MNKKPLIITGAVLGAICLVGLIAALQPRSEDETTTTQTTNTTISSSTEKTAEEPSDGQTSDTASEEPLPDKAVSLDYDEDTFSAHASRTRVLVFYDDTHAPSRALDTLITNSLGKLPDDISVFTTTLTDAPEEAATLGVTQPGVAISFTHDTQLKGVYVAPATPDLATMLAVLGIEG